MFGRKFHEHKRDWPDEESVERPSRLAKESPELSEADDSSIFFNGDGRSSILSSFLTSLRRLEEDFFLVAVSYMHS